MHIAAAVAEAPHGEVIHADQSHAALYQKAGGIIGDEHETFDKLASLPDV